MKTIETDRLRLRPWTPEDAEDLYEYAQSPLVGPRAGWPPHKNIEESKTIIDMFIREGDVYAIELKAENKVIGGLGLHKRLPDDKDQEEGQREIGYVLNPDYWGQGYVPEGVRALLDYGFNDLDLRMIWCAHHHDNMNSKRVIEKCGFTFQFTQESTIALLDNKEVVSYFYKIDKEDYDKRQETKF